MADKELKFKIGGDATELVNAADRSKASIEKLAQSAGMSSKQMTAALRGVPAQFTDIVTAVASGQAPLTVLIQQGGQLKDMFGGVGNATRALGGYVAGLVNPFTLAAAGAAALAVAYYQGAQESQRLSNALILSGNALGTTTGQLYTQAEAIKALTGATRGTVSDNLAEIIQSGRVTQGSLQSVTAAVTTMSQASGRNVSEMVKEFAELGKDPVAASLKYNEQLNYLTASTYKAIKAAQEQGDSVSAVTLAQNAYASATQDMGQRVNQNLGTIERGWLSVKKAVLDTVDAMKSIGREESWQQQLDEVNKALAWRTKAGGTAETTWFNTADLEKQQRVLEAIIAGEKEVARQVQATGAERKTELAAEVEYGELKTKYRTQEQRLAQDIERINKSSATAEEKSAWIAQARAAALGKEAKEAERLADSIAAMRRDDLTRWAKEAGTELEAMAKATTEWQKAQDALIEPLERQAEALAREVEFYDMTESAIQATLIARLEERKATLAQQEGMTGLVAELEREIEVRKRIAESAGDKEFLDANKEAMKEADRAAKEAAKDWQRASEKIGDAITDSLMRGFESGKSAAENLRDTVENMLKTMVLQPAIKGVVSNGLSLLGLGTGNSGIGSGANISSVLGALGGNSGAALSGNSAVGLATNAYSAYSGGGLLSGFLSGMTSAGSEAALGAAFTGPSASLAGGSIGAGASAGSILGSSASSFVNAIPVIGWIIAGMTAANSAYDAGYRWQEDGIAQNLLAPSHTFDQKFWGPILGDKTTAILSGSSLSQYLLSLVGLGASTPHAGGIVYSDGTNVTNPNTAAEIKAEYADPLDYKWQYESDWTKRYSQKVADALEPTATGIAQVLNSASDVFGNGSNYKVGLAFSADGDDDSRGRYSIIDSTGDEVFDWGRRKFDDDAADGIQEFLTATGEGIVAVLQQMDLPEWASGLLDGLEDTDLESVTTVVEQMKAIQATAEKLAPTLAMTEENFAEIYLKAGDEVMTAYYNLVATSSEQLADSYRTVSDAFDDVGYAIPDSIEGFRDLIMSLDETTEEGQNTITSLLGLSTAFGTVQSAIDSLKTGVADATYNLRSPQEQAAIQQQKLADAARDAGVAIPSSVDELLRLADSIDYTTQAGMQLAVAMPGLAAAFSAARTAALTAGKSYSIDTIASDASSAVDRAFDALQTAVDQQKAAISSQYEAQRSAWDSAVSAAQSVKSSLQSLAATLANAVESTAIESTAATLARRQSAQADLDGALAAARSGRSLTGYSDAITQAVSVFSGGDTTQLYATFLDYARDQGRANATLAELSNAATDQLKVQDLQIAAINGAAASAERAYSTQIAQLDQVLTDAQEQIDALNGINTGVMTVAEAIASLASAVAAAGATQNATGTDTRSTSQATQEITGMYANLVGRAPSAAEYEYWVGQFMNEGTTAAQVTNLFNTLASNNLLDAGVEYWTQQMREGQSFASTSAAINQYLQNRNSHATGLESVPYDGYQATLHADEAVVDSQSKAAIRRYFGVSVSTGVGSSAELAAIRALLVALRTEMVNSAAMISSNTHRSAKVLERWEGMGLPAERSTV